MTDIPVPTPQPAPPITLRFWPWLLLTDALLRVVVAVAQQRGFISLGTAWFAQAAVVPFIIATMAVVHDAWLRDRFEIADAVPPPTVTLPRAMLVVLGSAVVVSVAYVLTPIGVGWQRALVVGIAVTLHSLFVHWLLPMSVTAMPATDPESVPAHDDDWHDLNDRLIIRLETERLSMQQRIDTYTLESALFGALAFSAFVTIVSATGSNQGAARKLLFLVREVLAGREFLARLAEEANLLAAIGALTLICSILFLSVIICRFRFNELLARADYWIRIAAQFNSKEDEIEMSSVELKKLPGKMQRRLESLKRDITEAACLADKEIQRLQPVITYMRLYRLLGVSVFAVVIITGAVWFSNALAVMFAILTLFVFAYPLADRWRDRVDRQAIALQDASRRILSEPGHLLDLQDASRRVLTGTEP